jgi:radical SAM superfamily enzyme YgiQ (UPF0313 family)
VLASGDILLVSCYEPGFQPIALGSPAAFLRRAGYEPRCLDLAVEELGETALGHLSRARLIAISAPMHTALALGLHVARRVRALNADALICFFGMYATLNEKLLRAAPPDIGTDRGLADVVMGPECEDALVALADSLRDGRAAPTAPTALHRVAFLPPDRSGLPPLSKYARLLMNGQNHIAGHVEATRGCKHQCRHCPIPPVYKGRFFALPVEVVLQDVRQQVAAGARHVNFGDPDFLNSAKHALAVARAVHDQHPQVTFSFTAKVQHIIAHADLFPELARLGCVFVVSAIESLSNHVLEILDKGHTGDDVLTALAVVRGAGISLRPTMVAFTPWTSLSDYVALCAFVREHALEDEVDPVQLAIRLLVPPGSLLLRHPAMSPHLGALSEEGLSYTWMHPDPRMDQLCERVASLVEEAVRDNQPGAATFARIHQLAAASAGQPILTPATTGPTSSRPFPPPRLSESWFCCAQPTKSQLRSVSVTKSA